MEYERSEKFTQKLHNRQKCKKFESFRAQNLDFQKFPQNCVTHQILNFQKY